MRPVDTVDINNDIYSTVCLGVPTSNEEMRARFFMSEKVGKEERSFYYRMLGAELGLDNALFKNCKGNPGLKSFFVNDFSHSVCGFGPCRCDIFLFYEKERHKLFDFFDAWIRKPTMHFSEEDISKRWHGSFYFRSEFATLKKLHISTSSSFLDITDIVRKYFEGIDFEVKVE